MNETNFSELGFRCIGPSGPRRGRMTLIDVIDTLGSARDIYAGDDIARSVGRMINDGRIRFEGLLKKGLKVRVTYN